MQQLLNNKASQFDWLCYIYCLEKSAWLNLAFNEIQ